MQTKRLRLDYQTHVMLPVNTFIFNALYVHFQKLHSLILRDNVLDYIKHNPHIATSPEIITFNINIIPNKYRDFCCFIF